MDTSESKVPAVLTAMSAVQAELVEQGIGKTQQNRDQGYKYRGIDDLYNAMGPQLAKHGLVITPTVLARTQTERSTRNGNIQTHVVVDVEWRFTSTKDGSSHTARTPGECLDVSDKATNKAMIAAYKYMMFLTFCVPIQGVIIEDADERSPESYRPPQDKERQAAKPASSRPSGGDEQRGEIPPSRSTQEALARIDVEAHVVGEFIRLRGKGTFNIRDHIKRLGGKWQDGAWSLPRAKGPELLKAVAQ